MLLNIFRWVFSWSQRVAKSKWGSDYENTMDSEVSNLKPNSFDFVTFSLFCDTLLFKLGRFLRFHLQLLQMYPKIKTPSHILGSVQHGSLLGWLSFKFRSEMIELCFFRCHMLEQKFTIFYGWIVPNTEWSFLGRLWARVGPPLNRASVFILTALSCCKLGWLCSFFRTPFCKTLHLL